MDVREKEKQNEKELTTLELHIRHIQVNCEPENTTIRRYRQDLTATTTPGWNSKIMSDDGNSLHLLSRRTVDHDCETDYPGKQSSTCRFSIKMNSADGVDFFMRALRRSVVINGSCRGYSVPI